jgi:hypothetical protein
MTYVLRPLHTGQRYFYIGSRIGDQDLCWTLEAGVAAEGSVVLLGQCRDGRLAQQWSATKDASIGEFVQ